MVGQVPVAKARPQKVMVILGTVDIVTLAPLMIGDRVASFSLSSARHKMGT